MFDQIVLERQVQIEEQCKKIRCQFNLMQLYLFIQLIIVISYISLPWLYEYQKESICYLICRLLQYSFHLFSVIQIKKTISEGQIQFIEYQLNGSIDVWAVINGNHRTLSKCNQFVYFIMFFLGNFLFLLNTLLLNKWILVVQLIFGWVLQATYIIVSLVICLILPFLIYLTFRQRFVQEDIYEPQFTQFTQFRSIRTQFKFSELNGQTFQPCYICLQNYNNDDIIVKLTCNPNHIFHSDCILPWAEINDTCPVCRGRLELELEQ